VTARPATTLFATTASKRATSRVTVQNHVTLPLPVVLAATLTASATAATNLAIWLKIVPPRALLPDKSATSVAVWVTSLATALQGVLVVWEVACVVAMVVVVVVATEEAMEEDSAKVLNSATPAAASATCRATALKAKSATTVSGSYPECFEFLLRQLTIAPGGEYGHLSKDCSTPSTDRVCYKCKQPGHIQAECPN
jgi:hypothetical protein